MLSLALLAPLLPAAMPPADLDALAAAVASACAERWYEQEYFEPTVPWTAMHKLDNQTDDADVDVVLLSRRVKDALAETGILRTLPPGQTSPRFVKGTLSIEAGRWVVSLRFLDAEAKYEAPECRASVARKAPRRDRFMDSDMDLETMAQARRLGVAAATKLPACTDAPSWVGAPACRDDYYVYGAGSSTQSDLQKAWHQAILEARGQLVRHRLRRSGHARGYDKVKVEIRDSEVREVFVCAGQVHALARLPRQHTTRLEDIPRCRTQLPPPRALPGCPKWASAPATRHGDTFHAVGVAAPDRPEEAELDARAALAEIGSVYIEVEAKHPTRAAKQATSYVLSTKTIEQAECLGLHMRLLSASDLQHVRSADDRTEAMAVLGLGGHPPDGWTPSDVSFENLERWSKGDAYPQERADAWRLYRVRTQRNLTFAREATIAEPEGPTGETTPGLLYFPRLERLWNSGRRSGAQMAALWRAYIALVERRLEQIPAD